MQQLRKDKTKDKSHLTLEDWTEHETSFPYVVSVFLKTAPNFGRRFAFGFKTEQAASIAFDALLTGEKTPKYYIHLLTDQSLIPFLKAM